MIKPQSRTNEIYCGCQAKSTFIKIFFSMRSLPLWISLPLMLCKEKYSIETIERKLKRYFIGEIGEEVEHPDHMKKCWRDYSLWCPILIDKFGRKSICMASFGPRSHSGNFNSSGVIAFLGNRLSLAPVSQPSTHLWTCFAIPGW